MMPHNIKLLLFLSCLSTALVPQSAVEAVEIKLGNHLFTLPEGFEIELVAGPGLVDRPIMADYDPQGFLYVADSSGSNERVEKQLETKPHRIVRLEDTNGDGKFDRSLVFADKMMFPEGVLWHDGSIYCGAPPSIWKLTDKNGDGVADERLEWFKGEVLTGCANDIHGPYLGLDGLLYWCKGGFGKMNLQFPGQSFTDSAAHIFRMRSDGIQLESLMAGGMDNPVEIVFTPEGEAIFTTTFYSHPQAGKRDALVHAIYGGVYPKVHNVIDPLVQTGELLPALSHLGPAAPSGLEQYRSTVFGPDYRNDLFSTLFNLRKIVRHKLEKSGSTYKSTDSDFLVSDNPDFHPTDVMEDADGSLLVVDTGGWYKICCPTSQLAKPDVLGAIYRIRRVGAKVPADPRGLKIDWATLSDDALVTFLGDARPFVVKRARSEIQRKGAAMVPHLSKGLHTTNSAVMEILWALNRISHEEARVASRKALALPRIQRNLLIPAVAGAGLHRDKNAAPLLVPFLAEKDLHLARTAATALGRIGGSESVPPLLKAAEGTSDPVFTHSLIFALIEINQAEAVEQQLSSLHPRGKRAAWIALNQIAPSRLKPAEIVAAAGSNDENLKPAANWILARRPEWAEDVASFYEQRLSSGEVEQQQQELLAPLTAFAGSPVVQKVFLKTLRGGSSKAAQTVVLNAIEQARPNQLNESLRETISSGLTSTHTPVVLAAVRAANTFSRGKTNQFQKELLLTGSRSDLPPAARLEALTGTNPGEAIPGPLFSFLVSRVTSTNPPMERAHAASVLGKARLNNEQLRELLPATRQAGPLELNQLLAAFEQVSDEALAVEVINTLQSSEGVSALRAELVQTRLAKFPEKARDSASALIKRLNANLEQQTLRLDEISRTLSKGDVRKGQAVFHSTKAACFTCHTIGYVGGNVGPDLTRVGAIRTERDLIEAVLFPSASFVRNYEPSIVALKNGEQVTGVVRRETPDSIFVAVGLGNEMQLAKSEVEEIRPGTLSLMPEGFDQQFSKEELADLVAFLKSLK